MADDKWSTEAPGALIERHLPGFLAILRLRLSDGEELGAIEQMLGTGLPAGPNQIAGSDPRALSIGPGEWMIVSNRSDFHASVFESRNIHLADVTNGYVSYAISGDRAGDLLAKGCTLDFHPRVFTAGQCAQSVLAQVFVTIERPSVGAAFLLHADASLAHHLELWFEDAVLEFHAVETK